ncbi:UNVERIFIED_CONTAM: hypothetical protein HDU68_008120 [Siphonaria sp. JEL0065]|nr:hypothetical protein HDU68_008120 [Siphonaria sp. JEL0065]
MARQINPAYIVGSSEIPGFEIVQTLGIVLAVAKSITDSFDLQGAARAAMGQLGATGNFQADLETGMATQFTSHCERANDDIVRRLSESAAARGANAIVGVEFDSKSPKNACVYGTAVVIAQRR